MAPGKGARMVESFSFFSDSFSLASLDTKSAFRDRKSTRLNSSHSQISYAVFCLKKKMHHAWAVRVACQWLPHLLEHLFGHPGRCSCVDHGFLRQHQLVVAICYQHRPGAAGLSLV